MTFFEQYNKYNLKHNFLSFIERDRHSLRINNGSVDGVIFQGILNLQDFAKQPLDGSLSTRGISEKECAEDFRYILDYLFDNNYQNKRYQNFLSHIFDYLLPFKAKNVFIEYLLDKEKMSINDIREMIRKKGVIGSPDSWDLLDEYEARLIAKEKQLIATQVNACLNSLASKNNINKVVDYKI